MNYKEMFDQWYNETYYLNAEGNCDSCGCGIGLPVPFDKLPPAMQQGVWLQFFREKGVSITIRFGLSAGYYCEISEDDENDDIVLTDFENYNTAFNTAIETAGKVLEGVK